MNQDVAVRERAEIAPPEMNGNKSITRGVGTQAPLTMNELKFFGSMIHEAGLIPKTNNETRQQLEARAMAKVIAGHSYGFDPILSLRLFDVINGKLQPTSECTSVLIKKSQRYNYKVVTWDVNVCDLLFVGKAADGTWKPLGHSIFTIDDAKRAGYTTGPNKGNWDKIPRNMLLARAITNGRRLFCADVMDPGGYFGASGLEETESTTAPEDLEFAEPQQLNAAPEFTGEVIEPADINELPTERPPDVDPEPVEDEAAERSPESRIADLLTAIQDRSKELGIERYAEIANGRSASSMDEKQLTSFLKELNK